MNRCERIRRDGNTTTSRAQAEDPDTTNREIDSMSLVTGYIDTDVPVSFADREWREFVGRSVFDRFPEGFEDLRSSLADLDADAGRVIFADLGPNHSRVSVELQYESDGGAERGKRAARAQRELDGDLRKFREFVARRCDQELCRA